jgi:hypothetical protein
MTILGSGLKVRQCRVFVISELKDLIEAYDSEAGGTLQKMSRWPQSARSFLRRRRPEMLVEVIISTLVKSTTTSQSPRSRTISTRVLISLLIRGSRGRSTRIISSDQFWKPMCFLLTPIRRHNGVTKRYRQAIRGG